MPLSVSAARCAPRLAISMAEPTGPLFSPMGRLWPSDFKPHLVINGPTLPWRATLMANKGSHPRGRGTNLGVESGCAASNGSQARYVISGQLSLALLAFYPMRLTKVDSAEKSTMNCSEHVCN